MSEALDQPGCYGQYLGGNVQAERDCTTCPFFVSCYSVSLAKANKAPAHTHTDLKDTNPKDALGVDKLPLHLWPAAATAYGCLGMLEGVTKYGRNNFRDRGVRASIYVAACKRHLDAWFEGEEVAPDSGNPHLANALACLAIIIDADTAGKLIDDRNFKGAGYRAVADRLTALVPQIRAKFAHHSPRHFTIADNATPTDESPPGSPDAAPEQATTETFVQREKSTVGTFLDVEGYRSWV